MEPLLTQIAERAQRQYYGKYRGFVVDNEDPEQRGRLKVRVPSVLGDQTLGWALPCLPFGGLANQGLFMVPEIDSQIWVEFEEGNLERPIWVGVFWQQGADVPEEAAKTPPTTRVLRTPSGHVLQFDDADGEEQFRLAHPSGAEMIIDPQGTVNLTDASGNSVVLDAASNALTISDASGNEIVMDSAGTTVSDSNGNKIVMAASGIDVKGAQIVLDGSMVAVGGQGGEPLLKGATFLSLFATHMHTCTAPGSPTSPPIPTGQESSALTTAAFAK